MPIQHAHDVSLLRILVICLVFCRLLRILVGILVNLSHVLSFLFVCGVM